MQQQNIIVLFGGPTVEHEVSVVTALEVIKALDPARFNVRPLYWAPDGQLYTGAALLQRQHYPFGPALRQQLQRASFNAFMKEPSGRPLLQVAATGWLTRATTWPVDCVVPVAHGSMMEDGNMQGLFTALGLPFTGPDTFAAALFMNKSATKTLLAAHGVPVLPSVLVPRPHDGTLPDYQALVAGLTLPAAYPLIVKPNFLGSSIGVTRAADEAQLAMGLAAVFRFDTAAIIEPCVQPLVEYNVSVSRAFGGMKLSAIEQPERKGAVLDFSTKYIGSGAKKAGKQRSAGMRFSGRTLNPETLSAAQRDLISKAAHTVMQATNAKGAPRIDFISNEATGEIWLNEVNSVPGDFASFLWEAADEPKTFTELLSALIDEAVQRQKADARLSDPAAAGATIFKR